MNENMAASKPEEVQQLQADDCQENYQNNANYGDSKQEQLPISESNQVVESCNYKSVSNSESDSDRSVISDSSSTSTSNSCSSDSLSNIAAQGSFRASKKQRKRKREKSSERHRKNIRKEVSSSSDSEEEKLLKNRFQAENNAAYSMRNPDKSRTVDRRLTYKKWPHQKQDIDQLVDSGFFFTGTGDIVRCFYCDIGLAEWNADDDPFIEHARHSPDCPYLKDKKGQDYINQVQQDWAKVYKPKRPELSQSEQRLKTFQNSSWPSDLSQTPCQIAEAGFYYVGEGDCVRCHFCDGGLREWEPNDDPWVEHARWFPFCKFVLKVKGNQFIQNAVTRNVNISDPRTTFRSTYSIEGQAMACAEENRREELLCTAEALRLKKMGFRNDVIRRAIDKYIDRTGQYDFTTKDLMKAVFEMEINDEPWSDEETADEMPNTGTSSLRQKPLMHPAAQQLRCDGFTTDEVRLAINKYIEKTGHRHFKTEELRHIIVLMKENTSLFRDELQKIEEGKKICGDDEDDGALTIEAQTREYQYLTEKFKCLICHDKERCIVYRPCGHRIACEPCGEGQTNCSFCGVQIIGRVKSYLTKIL